MRRQCIQLRVLGSLRGRVVILVTLFFLLESSLELVIIVEIAVLALALCVDESVGVGASIRVAVSTVLVVAMVTHSLKSY